MKIAHGLALMIAVVVLTTGVLVALVMSSWLYSSYVDEKHNWTASITGAIAAGIGDESLAGHRERLLKQFTHLQRQNPEIVYLYLADDTGQLLLHTPTGKMAVYRPAGKTQQATAAPLSDSPEILDIAYPLAEREPATYLHVGFSRPAIDEFIAEVRNKALLTTIFILAAAMVVSVVVARRWSRPIMQLAQNLNAYTEGREMDASYGGELKRLKDSKNEISQLFHSFTQMMRGRSDYESELEAYKNNLEALARQRTRELENVIHSHELAEVSLVEAKTMAEEASRAKSEFLSHMSHELRTPLNAVLGFAQLIQSEGLDNKAVNMGVEQILDASNKLMQLIETILDYSKNGEEGIELSTQPVDMLVMLDECVEMVQPEAGKNQISINKASTIDHCMVSANAARLRQVVHNLLSNAVKYNKHGGEIDIILEVEQGKAVLRVRDTGVGIPEEFKSQVFQAFSKLDKYMAVVEGTGIGLAISKRFIERMGGRIGFTSQAGEGSEFWISLPLLAAINPYSDSDMAYIESFKRSHSANK